MMRESAEDWQIRDSVRISRKRKIVISEHQSEVVAGRGPLPSCSRQLAFCTTRTLQYRYTEQFFVFARRTCEKRSAPASSREEEEAIVLSSSRRRSEVLAGSEGPGPLPSCSRQLADCIYDLGHCMQYLLFTGTYRYTEQFFVFGRRPCEKNRSIVLYFFLPATDGLIGIINSIVCTYNNLQSYMPTWLPLTAPPIVWGVTLPMPPSYEPD
jgi:hypothetical protein